MSKAFTKDDAGGAELLVVPRAPLPDGTPNYVTRRGLRLLRAELAALERERSSLHARDGSGALDASDAPARLSAVSQRLVELQARLASAELVAPPTQPSSAEVRFGASVRVRHESGKEATYRLVGVDEADVSAGFLAFSSPLARALLGRRAGDVVELRTPRSQEELELLEVRYGDDTHE
jgi:transcription elongation factor GreB